MGAGKVTSFVTRPAPGGPEVAVFAHPLAGVQLPAGTLEPGEDPLVGARREAWEETCLADLEAVGVLGTRPAAPYGGDAAAVRTLVHFQATGAAPDEWWVVTPDGGGLSWRCHWIPVAAPAALHPAQQPWLDAARDRLAGAGDGSRPPPVPVAAGETLLFEAPPGPALWARVAWLGTPDPAPAPDRVRVCAVTAADEVVAVAAPGQPGRWTFPAADSRSGEPPAAATARALAPAGARLVEADVLGYHRVATGPTPATAGGPPAIVAEMWARVTLAGPRSVARVLVPHAGALDALPVWRNPVAERIVSLAAHRSALSPGPAP